MRFFFPLCKICDTLSLYLMITPPMYLKTQPSFILAVWSLATYLMYLSRATI